MLSVSDILKILDQIPVWKTLSAMPKRIAELEARVAALEAGKAAHPTPGPTDCVKCHATMVVVSEAPHPTTGAFGHQEHSLRCDNCGNTSTRRFIPGEGYR